MATEQGTPTSQLPSNCEEQSLATKKSKTLTFLRDIVQENKALRLKLKELEENHSKCASVQAETEARLSERYEHKLGVLRKSVTEKKKNGLMQKMEEREAEQAGWREERDKLLAQVGVLKAKVDATGEELKKTRVFEFKCQDLEARARSAEGALAELRLEADLLREEHSNQLAEIQRLGAVEGQKASVTAELHEVAQKKKELEFRLERAQKQLADPGERQAELMLTLTTLRNKLTKFHKEKDAWSETEKRLKHSVENLTDENANLRRALADSEKMRQDLQTHTKGVVEELNALKKASEIAEESKTFKEFVQIKRELTQVKRENAELKTAMSERPKSGSVPVLRGSQIQSSSSVGRIHSSRGGRPPSNSSSGGRAHVTRK